MKSFADYGLVEQVVDSLHGTTWLAQAPERLGRGRVQVHLKVVGRHAGPEEFRRVANELRLLHSIDSGRVVQLLDAGSHDGQLFVTTPIPAGGSLAAPIAPLDEDAKLAVIADAAEGVHALHELGIAHRNIRPASIHIDDEGRGLLAGFDLAQLVQGASTQVAGPIGPLAYISPQLLLGEQASRQTDLWSLGMTLHSALTGHSAIGTIPDSGLLDACRHVLHTEPKLSAELHPLLARHIDRCLGAEHEPFATALDLSNVLRAYTTGVFT